MMKAVIVYILILFSDSGYLFSGSRPASPSSGIKTPFLILWSPLNPILRKLLFNSLIDFSHCFLAQTTFHWSQWAAHHPQAPLRLPRYLVRLVLVPVPVLPDNAALSSALLDSTSAAGNSDFSQLRPKPRSCHHLCHHVFTCPHHM